MINSRIPSLLGIIFVLVGTIAGVLLIKEDRLIKLQAAQALRPRNVRITNIDDSSFTVSWITDKKTTGFVAWKESQSKITNIVSEEENLIGYIHSVDITNLDPQTNYSFKIYSEGFEFDNNGIPWQTKTGNPLPPAYPSLIATGKVVDQFGRPSDNSLVYATIGGSSPISTRVSPDGVWVLPISTARSKDLSTHVPINKNSTLIEIIVQTGNQTTTRAQVYAKASQPVPPIVIGRINNFKNIETNQTDYLPVAEVWFPENMDNVTRFGTLIQNLEEKITDKP